MPIDASHAGRSESPVALDSKIVRNDKSYRRYASTVDKALSIFDSGLQEWADYISFLGRLLKALQSRPSDVSDVPHTALIAKRLAQCLDPRLPSGVHQKALEIYACVFAILGKEGLTRDFFLYLPGLSPTLSFASLSVKPALFSLFEQYVIVLHPVVLQPALKAIVLALLPGLEEETSEDFERAYALLEKFRDAVGSYQNDEKASFGVTSDREFWQSLFLATMTSSSRRQGALNYLNRNLPRLDAVETTKLSTDGTNLLDEEQKLPAEVVSVVSPEPGLLIRCFCAGLMDEQILVQRGFLDLLVTHLPLSSGILQRHIKPSDLRLLISAAASVVARREMSLNRRLWLWFLGPEKSGGPETSCPTTPNPNEPSHKTNFAVHSAQTYFDHYGLQALTDSLLTMIRTSSLSPITKAKPFRICLSLMDRSEIGGRVIPRIFMPVMESVWEYEKLASSKEDFSEVLRSAHVLFDGVQSNLIWGDLITVLHQSLMLESADQIDLTSRQKSLDLVWFVVTKFNVREEEMLVLHIPKATLLILSCIHSTLCTGQSATSSAERKLAHTAMKITSRLLDLTPARGLHHNEDTMMLPPTESNQELSTSHIISAILSTYATPTLDFQGARTSKVGEGMGSLILLISANLLSQAITDPEELLGVELALSLLAKVTHRYADYNGLDVDNLLSVLQDSAASLSSGQKNAASFERSCALVPVLEYLCDLLPAKALESDHRVTKIMKLLVECLWEYLSPSEIQYGVEATRGLWRIYVMSPDKPHVEGTIASLMISQPSGVKSRPVNMENARRFMTLWSYSTSKIRASSDRRSEGGRGGQTPSGQSLREPDLLGRPLLLLLDSLADQSDEICILTISWLQSLPNIASIVAYLLYHMHSVQYLMDVRAKRSGTATTPDHVHTAAHCTYYISKISQVVQYSPETVRTALEQILPFTTDNDPYQQPQRKSDSKESLQTPVNTASSYIINTALCILEDRAVSNENDSMPEKVINVRKAALELLRKLLRGKVIDLSAFPGLDDSLLAILTTSVEMSDNLIQRPIMECILVFMRHKSSQQQRSVSSHQVNSVQEKEPMPPELVAPSDRLLECLILGLSSTKSRPVLDQWVDFLGDCLPFYDGQAFQALIPLVECFNRSIEEVFRNLRAIFGIVDEPVAQTTEPINTLNILLNGLEQTLARGHAELVHEEVNTTSQRNPEQAQSFFGNMVSGVFTSETSRPRPLTANDRLTVLICFKDAVSVAYKMWSWGDNGPSKHPQATGSSASFNYASIRLRNRTRRLLEHLFAAEPLECLETIIEIWTQATRADRARSGTTIFNLLHALEASRPKSTVPAIFNGIYSRTNPGALDTRRTSSLTSDISDVSLSTFLVAYARSIDDDALDEIWADCMVFLRDILSNPMPQRQVLPRLLEFVAILGEKIDNTNFGEQRRMRREIGDLFNRLLSATFTIKPLSFSDATDQSQARLHDNDASSGDIIDIIASILPRSVTFLSDTDRIIPAVTTVSAQILGPTFRWKTFPHNVTPSTLEILRIMSKMPEVSRIWRKDLAEAFNDTRFFCTASLSLARPGWMPIVRQWNLVDKDRISELLTRLTAPTSAGIMFGVGATSARLDADRKAQLNLRRITFLLLSANNDDFIPNMTGIQDKLAELLNATAMSSPSSLIRAEVYMVFRALTLKMSPVHLASLWPILTSELYEALSSLQSLGHQSSLTVTCILQAAKLLDVLLIVAPDDFQLCEWLYITDNIDAVYRPADWAPKALVDRLSESLDSAADTPIGAVEQLGTKAPHDGIRRPLLRREILQDVKSDEQMVERVLRPFLRQLSISAFESTYHMETADRLACENDLLGDIFDEATLV